MLLCYCYNEILKGSYPVSVVKVTIENRHCKIKFKIPTQIPGKYLLNRQRLFQFYGHPSEIVYACCVTIKQWLFLIQTKENKAYNTIRLPHTCIKRFVFILLYYGRPFYHILY